MTDVTTSQGTRVRAPEHITVQDQDAEIVLSRGSRRNVLTAGIEGGNQAATDALLAGLAQQDVEVRDAFTLAPTSRWPAPLRWSVCNLSA